MDERCSMGRVNAGRVWHEKDVSTENKKTQENLGFSSKKANDGRESNLKKSPPEGKKDPLRLTHLNVKASTRWNRARTVATPRESARSIYCRSQGSNSESS